MKAIRMETPRQRVVGILDFCRTRAMADIQYLKMIVGLTQARKKRLQFARVILSGFSFAFVAPAGINNRRGLRFARLSRTRNRSLRVCQPCPPPNAPFHQAAQWERVDCAPTFG